MYSKLLRLSFATGEIQSVSMKLRELSVADFVLTPTICSSVCVILVKYISYQPTILN